MTDQPDRTLGGWVRFEANRRAFVSGLTANDIEDHYELRGLVFGLAARRVAETATDEQLLELASRYREMVKATDMATFTMRNERFLAKLLGIASSSRIRAALLVTPSIVPIDEFFAVIPDGRRVQTEEMRKLVRLLKARRADDAERLMQNTLRKHAAVVVAAFDDAGLLGGTDE